MLKDVLEKAKKFLVSKDFESATYRFQDEYEATVFFNAVDTPGTLFECWNGYYNAVRVPTC